MRRCALVNRFVSELDMQIHTYRDMRYRTRRYTEIVITGFDGALIYVPYGFSISTC